MGFTPSDPVPPPTALGTEAAPEALLQMFRDRQQRQELESSGKGGKTWKAGGIVSGAMFGEAFGFVGAAFMNAQSRESSVNICESQAGAARGQQLLAPCWAAVAV